jgi:hypothetical protein
MGIHDGPAHNPGAVIVKAVQGELVFGAHHGEGWGVGLTGEDLSRSVPRRPPGGGRLRGTIAGR